MTKLKALVVFAVIMPLFLVRDAAPVGVQMARLALAPVAIGLLTDSAWATASGTTRDWPARSRRRQRALGVTGGTGPPRHRHRPPRRHTDITALAGAAPRPRPGPSPAEGRLPGRPRPRGTARPLLGGACLVLTEAAG